MSGVIQRLLIQWLHLSKSQVGVNRTTEHTKTKGCRSDHIACSSVTYFASAEALIQMCRRDLNDTCLKKKTDSNTYHCFSAIYCWSCTLSYYFINALLMNGSITFWKNKRVVALMQKSLRKGSSKWWYQQKKNLTSALVALFIQTPETNSEMVNSELSEISHIRKESNAYERNRIKQSCFLSVFREFL